MTKLPLSAHEKRLIMQSISWLRTINEARPAGTPPVYPKEADIESSALFKRIRAGLTPMPWAPPVRNGHPAYDLIENARNEHPVTLEQGNGSGELLLDGASWQILAKSPDSRAYRLAFGNWPLSYRATAHETRRWPQLPADLDQGSERELVRLGDGRLLSKEVLRRERDDTQTQWRLCCCSPFNEHLYLTARRLPLDDAGNFSPHKIHAGSASRPEVFECRPFAAALVLFALCQEPWTRVTRYLALPLDGAGKLDEWLDRYRQGASPLGFDPAATTWSVYEIAEDGRPLSGWQTDRSDLLQAVPEAADCA